MDGERIREKTLDQAKRHKASWIELGQCLYQIAKDKWYKSWGYLTFQAYCQKELGLKEATASKLMKSYQFLEAEEPQMASTAFAKECKPGEVPDYQSVNILRLAKDNEKITTEDFADLRQSVITRAKEPKEVRAAVKQLLENRDERDPEEIQKARRNTAIKRLASIISSSKRQLESERLVPSHLLKAMADLVQKLEDQLD